MNISKREKTLLILLGVVIFTVLFLKFVFIPELSDISVYKNKISQYSQNYDMNMAYKRKVEGMDSNLKIMNQQLKDLRAQFPPKINSEEILMLVDQMAKKAGVDISNIALEEATEIDTSVNGTESLKGTAESGSSAVTGITDNKLLAALNSLGMAASGNFGIDTGETAKVKKVNIPDGKAYVFSVNLSATGTNKQIKDFFNTAVMLKNKAMFNNISLTNSDKGILTLTASLEFYGIMDKNAGLYTLLGDGSWVPLAAAGRNNLFGTYDGYTGSVAMNKTAPANSTENATNDTTINTAIYDFSVTSSTFGGSLAPPSVSVFCKSVDATSGNLGAPLLYGDNKGIENIEVYVEEKAGTLFCKYKTQHSLFPEKNYDQMVEFVPIGDSIKMIVASSTRTDSQDKSGVKLTITNKTSKKFQVEVLYDNQAKPRLTIEKVGDVVVDYK